MDSVQFRLSCGQASVAINITVLKFTGVRNADFTGLLSAGNSRAVSAEAKHAGVHRVVF